MEKIIRNSCAVLAVCLLLASCKKFEETNTNPYAANTDQVQIEYFINNAIIGAQMDPGVAERSFVLYWKTAAHQQSDDDFATGYYNDEWTSVYYGQVSGWLNSINTAIQVAGEKELNGTAKPYNNNLIQVARIWRAYLMSEMSDNFGPVPINGFQGINPDFNDTKSVYYYVLDELKDASSKLDLSIVNPDELAKQDPAFGYNYLKWKKYAYSMRLRLAMRLSEVDEVKSKAEFEDAAMSLGNLITKEDESFQIQEKEGWHPLSGVMSRPWNTQPISSTLNNIYIGLGDIKSQDQLADSLHSFIKPADWIGLKFADHFSTFTNDPSAGYWLDGLPFAIDPRAYKTFIIPGNFTDPNFTSTGVDSRTTSRNLVDEKGAIVKTIVAKHTWNARTAGSWGVKGTKNQVLTFEGTMPRLSKQFRTSTNKRIFFAPWETYFLLAEANVRGWTTPVSGKMAYEEGIKLNFAYWGLSSYLPKYLISQGYNRLGTSASWDDITEPPMSHNMNFRNGYTDAAGVVTVNYPKNDLYKNGTIKNDHLTKIITQKYLANMPYLPLEAWNDKRRLGLPFFENPVIENSLLDMPALNKSNYMTSKVEFFPQRLKYASSLPTTNPRGYNQAVGYLGGSDAVLTPLWWAKK